MRWPPGGRAQPSPSFVRHVGGYARLPLTVALLPVLALLLASCGGEDPAATWRSADVLPGEELSVEVELSNYAFSPRHFELRQGETIEFIMDSVDILHSFTVEELDIDWHVERSDVITEQFTFDQPGEYRLICIIPGHEVLGMRGTILVAPPAP